jgi:hypothetical protein
MTKKLYYSVYSGICYHLDENMSTSLDDGQLPLKSLTLKNCKKCHDRRYIGFNTQNFTYMPCSCVTKSADLTSIKQKFNIQSPSV